MSGWTTRRSSRAGHPTGHVVEFTHAPRNKGAPRHGIRADTRSGGIEWLPPGKYGVANLQTATVPTDAHVSSTRHPRMAIAGLSSAIKSIRVITEMFV